MLGLEHFLRNVQIDLECPKCKRKFKARLDDIQKGRVKCPYCGVEINIKLEGDDLGKVFKAAKEFDKTLKKFGK